MIKLEIDIDDLNYDDLMEQYLPVMDKIFVIEDDVGLRGELLKLLASYGYACESSNDFQNIVPAALAAQADLVLLDVSLPYYDGFQVCRELRKSSAVPVIVVTSRSSEMDELLSMLIFGTIGIFVEMIPLPSSVIALARSGIGAALLALVMLAAKKPLHRDAIRQNLKFLLPSGAALGFNWILLFEAYRYTTVAVATLCYYMGGGTPTTLSAPQLDALCTKLEEAFDLTALREYTVEAGRPDTITQDKLEALKKHGVTRVSVNPQTMDDAVLEAIGRKHTAADVLTALSEVRRTGGFAVNMDLIAGLPADTPERFDHTLETVLALAPENITVHTLALKKGSGIMFFNHTIPYPQGE